MSERPNVAAIKNLLICAGLYYLSRWVALPLALGFGKIPRGIIYTGDFQSSVLAPIVLHLPVALIASVVGASLIWLVDSARPLRWVMLVTVAYAVFGLFGYHWAHQPVFHDRVFQVLGALFPAATCLLSGGIARQLRSPSQVASTPD